MRTPNLGTISFNPEDPPSDPNELQNYLRRQNVLLQAAITALAAGHLDQTYVAPTKPRDGDIRYADGTSWAPGVKGLYMHNGTTWVLIKAL
jgi:hypothetical protein